MFRGSLTIALQSEFDSWPPAIAHSPPRARFAIEEFFAARIDNPHTRRSYLRAAKAFFAFAATLPGGNDLGGISSLHVSAWKQAMRSDGNSSPTIKLRLAALSRLFRVLVAEHILIANPAAVVERPKHSVTTGKTPAIDAAEMRRLLDVIDTSTIIGLRDRAMIGTMAYTFARISAVAALRVAHVFSQKQRLWLRLTEKGGKSKDVPCHHHLETYLTEWIETAAIGASPQAPLFQTLTWTDAERRGCIGEDCRKQRGLSGRAMTQAMTWDMVQRRARQAGITTAICNHTFRAVGITAYLSNGGTIERAAAIAGHASTRTTQLYDRRPDDVTLDEIERIRFD